MITVKIKIWLMLFIIGAFQTYYLNAEVRIVCYYTNWSVYRPGTAKFNPQNINPYLCTHLIYAFGGFTKDNTLKPFDKYQDIEKGGYAKFTGLKTYNKNLKTMIAIGGWNEGSSRFSSLAASSEKRKEFVKNVVKFLRVNHFDGLDLDWEYPSFRDGGKPHDKENYCQLVQDLREEFEREAAKTGRPKLLLTMAVPAGIEYIKKGFDVEKLNKYLDWMNILSYDYHSAFEPSVNHHAPLYPLEEDNEYNYDADLNIDHTIKYYLENGADRQKLVLGIPTYGRSYTLFNPDANELGAPADGPGEMGDATKEKGYLAYYEICENINSNSGWTVVQPNPSAMGPYAYKEDQWVGYDDENIVRLKAKYVAEQDLGGIMFWSIDNDDFRGKCHNRPYPLIEAAKEALIESSSNLITSEERVVTRSRTRPSSSKNIESSEIVQNSGGRQTITQTTVLRSRGGNRFNSRNQNQFDDGKESTTVIKGSNRRRVANSRSKQNQRRQSQRRSTTTSTTTTTTTTSAPLSVITPSYTTPPPPATPDSGSDFKCEDEGFFPHPSDCKKYYWCLSSGPSELGIVAHQFTCPAGLYFNKAADSCDYSRNVLCNKKPKTTTTTSTSTTTAQPKTAQSTTTPRTTTQRTRAPITAATSKTTLRQTSSTTTTPIPDIYEDDEYEYYDDEEIDGGSKQVFDSEEDPKVIKELIALIKKVGGVQELEKQLFTADGSSGSTTPPAISKSLYERVLSSRNNNAQVSGGSRNVFGTTNARTTNFRNGVQFSGSEEESSNRGKPQYVTINRSRQRTTSNDDESLESARTNTNFNSDESLIQTNSNSNSQLPSYVTIARGTKTKVTETSTSEESPNEAVLRVKEQRRNQFRSNSEMPEYVTIARGTSRKQQNENVESVEDDSSDEEELNVKTTFNSGSERRFVNRLETVKNVNMPEYVSTTNFRQRNLADTSSELNINGNEDSQIILSSSSESSNRSKQNSETSTSKYQTLNRSRTTFVSSSTATNQQTETSEEATTKTNTNSEQTLLLSIKDGQQNQKETVAVTVNESEKDVSDTDEETTGTTETVDILLKPLLNIPVLSGETKQTSVEQTVIETETSTNDKTVPILQPARPFSITQKTVLDEQTNEQASTTSTLKVSENQTTANDVVYTSRGTLLTPHGFVLGHNGSTSSNNNHINNITKIEYTIIDNQNIVNYNLNETSEINKNNRVPIVRIASDNRFESQSTSQLGVRGQESTGEKNTNETNVFNVSRNRFRIQGTSGLQSNQSDISTQNRFRSQNSTEVQSNENETSSQITNEKNASRNRIRIQGASNLQSNQSDISTQNQFRSQNSTEVESNQIETSSQNRFRVQGSSRAQANQATASRNRFGSRESSNTAQNRFRAQETSTEAQNQTETVTRNKFTGRRVVSRFRTTTTTPRPSSESTRSRSRGRVRGTLATTTESIDDEALNASVERTYRPKSTFRDLSSLTAADFNRRSELNGNNRFRISRRRPTRVNVTTTTANATESDTTVSRTSTIGTRRRQSLSNENESSRSTITTEAVQDTTTRNYLFRPRGNRILAVKLNETETQSEEIQNNEENITEITSTDESSTISSINETSIEHEENEHIHLSETNIRETESIGRDVNQIVLPIDRTRRRKIIRKQRPIASTIDFTTETNELVMVDNVDARVSVTREQSVTEPNVIVRTRKVIRKLRPVNSIQNTELEQKNSTLVSNNSSSNSNSSENLVTQQRSQTTRFTSQRNRTFNRPAQSESTITRPTSTEGTVTVQNTSRRRYQSNNFNRFGTRPRLEVLRTSSSLNSEITRNSFDDATSKSSNSKVNQEESISQSKLESNSETNQNISEESQSISSNTETINNFEARSQLLSSETTRLNQGSSQSSLSTSQIESSSKQNEEYENQRLITTESEKAEATTDITMDDTTGLVSELTTANEDVVVTTANENDGLTSSALTTDDYATTLNSFEQDVSLTNQNETSIEKQTISTTTSTPSRLFRRPGDRTTLNRNSFSNRRDSVISTSSESARVNGFRRRFTTARPTTTVNYPSTTRRRTVYRQFTPRTSTRNYSFGNRRRNQANEEQNETDEYNSVNSNDQETSINLSSSRNTEENFSVSNQERTAQNDRLNKVSITANQERVISQINSGTRTFSKQNDFSEVNTKSTDEVGTTELNTENQLNIDLNQNSYDENELLSKQNNEQVELTTSNFEENRYFNTNQQETDYGLRYTSESNFGSSQTETEESNTENTEETNYGLRKSTSKLNIASSQTATENSNIEISEETNYGLKKSSSGTRTSQLEKTSSESLTGSSKTNEEQTSSQGFANSKFSKNQSASISNSNANSENENTNYVLKKFSSGARTSQLEKTSSESLTGSSKTNEEQTSSQGFANSKFSKNQSASISNSNANSENENTNYVLKKFSSGARTSQLEKTSSESLTGSSKTNEEQTSSQGFANSKFSKNQSASISNSNANSENENTNYVLKKSSSGARTSQLEKTSSESLTGSSKTNEEQASSQGFVNSKFSKNQSASTSNSNANSENENTNYVLKKSSSGIRTSQIEKNSSEFVTGSSIAQGSIIDEEQTSSQGFAHSKYSKNQSASTSNSNENNEESSILIHHVFAEPTTEYPETTRIDFIEEEGIKKNLKKLIEVNRYVEVNYKEDDAKNKTIKFGAMLDVPEIDKIGEINRVTVIKIVDGNITQTGDENLFLSETSSLRDFLNSTRPVTITTKIRASNKTVKHDAQQNETVNDLLNAHLQAIENALVNDDAKSGRKIRIDSHSKVANTYTLMPDFTEITTLALEALFQKDKLPTTTTSLDNEIQTPLPTLKQLVTTDNQPNESQNNLLNIKILKQDEDDSRSLKFNDDANILPIRILNDNKPAVNDETKVVYLLKNSPFIESGIKRENRSPQKGLNIKSDKMGGFITTTKSTTLSNVPFFRKNLLRRNQTTSILKKRPIVNETTTTELPTTTVNQSLQKLRNRTFKPRPNNNLLNNKLNNTSTKSNVTSTTTAKPNTNRFRFATRKVPVFRSTTQKISSSTERNDQDIEPSNHKSLNSKNLLDPETVVADDIVLAIHNIQAAPIRTSVEVNRNPKNIRYRPTTVRSLPKSRLKTIEQLPIIEDDVEYVEDDTETIKILGKDISKGKVLIHPSGKIQCLDQGNFPHPVSCRKFISCAKMENGAVIGWEYTCPKNLSFDPIGGICNWAAGLGCVS